MKNENMYIIRKMVRAFNAQDAIKKDVKTPVHEVFLVFDLCHSHENRFQTVAAQ
jgi:hypothetical protein